MTNEDQVAHTTQAVDKATATIERTSKFVRAFTVLLGALTLVAVIVFGVINLVQSADARHKNFIILQRVVEATNPNSPYSQHNSAQTQVEINGIILCLENHEDRLAARAAQGRIPPVRKGCP